MKSTSGKNIKLKSSRSNLDIVKSYLNGEKAFVQVGYDPSLETSNRKEGEEWEDSFGRRWVIKDGYKKRLPKKSTVINEKRCKCCNMDTRWGNYLDHNVWSKSGLCYDCFIENETKLRIKGVWKDYNKLRDLKNIKSYLTDHKQKFEEAKKWCEDHKDDPVSFMEEDGSMEKWEGKQDHTKILKDVTEDLNKINERLSNIDVEIDELTKKCEEAMLDDSKK